MARFQERPMQVGAQLDTGASTVSNTLASKLDAFSQRAGQFRAQEVERQSLSAGLIAGREKKMPVQNEFSIASKAFNRGLRASYIAEVETDIRSNISRIASENALNPVGFDNASAAWEQETLKGIPDIELQASVQNSIRNQSLTSYQAIAKAKHERDLMEMNSKINGAIEFYISDAETYAQDGDALGASTALTSANSMIDEQIESGMITFDEGDAAKKKNLQQVNIEMLRGNLKRDFDTFDSLGKALQAMEATKPPQGFTEQEWINAKSKVETDFKASLNRQQLDEANMVKVSDEEQEGNADKLWVGVLTGSLDTGQITSALQRGEISSDEAVKLTNRIGTQGIGVDNQGLIQQLEYARDQGDFAKVKQLAKDNWGTNLSGNTAAKWFNVAADGQGSQPVLATPQANDYRGRLKFAMGDSPFIVIEDKQRLQITNATNEYDNLIAQGVMPRDAMMQTLQNYKTIDQLISAERPPTYMYSGENSDLEALKKAAINTQNAYNAGQIDKAKYLSEMQQIKKLSDMSKQSKQWQAQQKTEQNTNKQATQ